MKSFSFFILVCILISSFGCRTVYDFGFEKKRESLIKMRTGTKDFHAWVPKHEFYTYSFFYPDSILDREQHVHYKYNRKRGVEMVSNETTFFDRAQPYIRPIDTTNIVSPVQLTDVYLRKHIFMQILSFRDSSKFELYGEGMSTCTMTPTYNIRGKYHLEGNLLRFFVQRSNSLEIDTIAFNYYADSLIQISEGSMFSSRYFKKIK